MTSIGRKSKKESKYTLVLHGVNIQEVEKKYRIGFLPADDGEEYSEATYEGRDELGEESRIDLGQFINGSEDNTGNKTEDKTDNKTNNKTEHFTIPQNTTKIEDIYAEQNIPEVISLCR